MSKNKDPHVDLGDSLPHHQNTISLQCLMHTQITQEKERVEEVGLRRVGAAMKETILSENKLFKLRDRKIL